jgi:predicted phage terminase large subunit-like protein
MLEAMARAHFASFVYLAFPVLHPGRRIIPNWHIDLMCWQAQKIFEGSEPPRCIFNLPPRSMKSFVFSVCLPAWLLGRNPSTRIICASYGEELAKKFSRECRALMQSALYRRLFPGTILSPQKSTEIEFETTKRGYRMATSVGGTLTGRGGEWLILDDVMKGEDSASDRVRTTVGDWFKYSARSRLDNPGQDKILVIMQRLHQEDLSGVLIKSGWPCLKVPAIATEPCRYEIGADTFHDVKLGELMQPEILNKAALDEARQDIGPHAFSAQYLQEPLPDEGDYLRAEYFQRADGPDPSVHQKIVMSVDPAAKKGTNNDFTAIIVWSASDSAYHVLHAVKGRWNVTESVAQIVILAEKYKVRDIIIEDTSSGTGVLELVKQKHMPLQCVGRHPTESKLIRLLRQLGKIETGIIKLPKEGADDFLEEIVNFPSARYDDYVDSMLLFLEWIRIEEMLLLGVSLFPPTIIRGDD